MKISYLVATYDCPEWLDRHLEDLLTRQTNDDFEVVVIHHKSPSYDIDIGEKWAAIDGRVRNLHDRDYGCYGPAWMHGWKHAKGEFVCNSNTDDFHLPQFTETMYKYMKVATGGMQTSKHEVAFGYGGIVVINEQGKQIGAGQRPPFDFQQMSYECHAGPQVCWRNDTKFREAVDWTLMHKRAIQYTSAFDYWIWLYFMSMGYHGLAIPDIITVYTQRADSVENSNKWANNWETYAAISEFFPHHFNGKLKHAPEFSYFKNLPPKDEWVACMHRGKKWRQSKHV